MHKIIVFSKLKWQKIAFYELIVSVSWRTLTLSIRQWIFSPQRSGTRRILQLCYVVYGHHILITSLFLTYFPTSAPVYIV